ncbi:hypothetical protein Plhal710r2_c036g0130111 [Plasmopara halstedii]
MFQQPSPDVAHRNPARCRQLRIYRFQNSFLLRISYFSCLLSMISLGRVLRMTPAKHCKSDATLIKLRSVAKS